MNDPRRRLGDIVARCGDARLVVARGPEAFEEDPLLVLRHAAKSIITDIGEAAKNLDGLVDEIAGVPWVQVARMRDRVIHRYFDVDYAIVWDTLRGDIPRLEAAVREFLADADADADADDAGLSLRGEAADKDD